jgi:multisubunit Na+/H+ antiporter MnhB subunit
MAETGMIVIGAIGLVAFLYVLIGVLSNKKIKPFSKALWIVAGLLFNILTAIFYYFSYEKK